MNIVILLGDKVSLNGSIQSSNTLAKRQFKLSI
jgi:hypothetical protein